MEAEAGSAGGASHGRSIPSAACQRLAPLFGGYFYLKIIIKKKCLVKASRGVLGELRSCSYGPKLLAHHNVWWGDRLAFSGGGNTTGGNWDLFFIETVACCWQSVAGLGGWQAEAQLMLCRPARVSSHGDAGSLAGWDAGLSSDGDEEEESHCSIPKAAVGTAHPQSSPNPPSSGAAFYYRGYPGAGGFQPTGSALVFKFSPPKPSRPRWCLIVFGSSLPGAGGRKPLAAPCSHQPPRPAETSALP